MTIRSDEHSNLHEAESTGTTERSEAYIDALQDQPTGDGFKTVDYYLLALTGGVIPVLLLMWGID